MCCFFDRKAYLNRNALDIFPFLMHEAISSLYRRLQVFLSCFCCALAILFYVLRQPLVVQRATLSSSDICGTMSWRPLCSTSTILTSTKNNFMTRSMAKYTCMSSGTHMFTHTNTDPSTTSTIPVQVHQSCSVAGSHPSYLL